LKKGKALVVTPETERHLQEKNGKAKSAPKLRMGRRPELARRAKEKH